MTMSPGMPFPGMSGVGATPQQPAAPTTFSMVIPPDANWEPFESTDVLEMDGFYCCQITKESARTSGDKPGVWFTLVVQDTDAKGKVLNRFLNDSRTTQKDTWHQWRGLLMSITGDLNAGKQGLAYQAGMFIGQYVYVKTGAYNDRESGAMRTGIDSWAKKSEWEAAYKANSHRWKPHPKGQASPGAGVGMLPGGAPAGFPQPSGGLPGALSAGGLPVGGGLPGAPSVPMAPQAPMPVTTPQPMAAPMQAPMAPQQPTFAPPQQPQFAPPPQFAAPPAPVAPPAPQSPFSFAQPPTFPANGAATPQPPPTAAGLASSFPTPGQG